VDTTGGGGDLFIFGIIVILTALRFFEPPAKAAQASFSHRERRESCQPALSSETARAAKASAPATNGSPGDV